MGAPSAVQPKVSPSSRRPELARADRRGWTWTRQPGKTSHVITSHNRRASPAGRRSLASACDLPRALWAVTSVPLLPALVFVLSLVAASASGRAMTVAVAPLSVLAQEAALVVRGQVVALQVEPVPGQLWVSRTRATVAVWRTYGAQRPAGAPAPDYVDVLLPGGSRAGLTTWVPGVPQVYVGEEVIVLLEPVAGGYAPMGYSLGLLRAGPGCPSVVAAESILEAVR